MNIDRIRKIECSNASCPYFEQRCIVFYGKECSKLGGNRIPVQRIPDNARTPTQKPTRFKPYFLTGLPEVEGDL